MTARWVLYYFGTGNRQDLQHDIAILMFFVVSLVMFWCLSGVKPLFLWLDPFATPH